MKLFVFITLLSLNLFCWGLGALTNVAQVGASYNKFFGPEQTSLGSKTQGFGILIGVMKRNSFYGISTAIQLDSLAGQQYLMDNSTKKLVSFSGYGASTYLGLRLTPLMSKSFLNPYLIGGGLFGITFLESKTANLTQLASSQSSLSAGYYLGFGFEQRGSSKISPYLELRFDYERGTFFEVKNFQIDKVSLLLGINY